MKASELRIGNIVSAPEVGHVPLMSEDIMDFQYGQKEFEPIPLTEEWLKRFGFAEVSEDGLWQADDEELFQIQSEYLNEQWGHIWDAAFTNAPLEYVHQLQNLYFSLTGSELELKT